MKIRILLSFAMLAMLAPSLQYGGGVHLSQRNPEVEKLTIAPNQVDFIDPIPLDEITLPRPKNNFSFPIDLKFLGFNRSDFNETRFLESSLTWYSPIERIPSYYTPDTIHDNNFTIAYDLEFLSTENVSNYRSFVLDNSRSDNAPFFVTSNENASYLPSSYAEEYLRNTYQNNGRPTLFFINTYSFDTNGYFPYFYNASVVDLDGFSIPRPYASNYQISGGGEKSRLLWIDLSAGPTIYRDSNEAGVNATLVPPIWEYSKISDPFNALADDFSLYLNTAIELRFVPSYIYTPLSASEEIRFEFLIVDLAQTGFDWFSKIDGDLFVNQYKKANANINWTYIIATWNWQADTVFAELIANNTDDVSRTLNPWPIMDYLDTMYTSLFSNNTAQVKIVPSFLFAFPTDYLFSAFLGIASNIAGQQSYTIAALNEKWADPAINLINDNWYVENNVNVANGNYYYLSGTVGTYEDIFDTAINVDSGEVNLYIVDSYNFAKYENNESFRSVYQSLGLTSFTEVNVTLDIWDQYYWLIESVNGAAQFDIELDQYRDRSFGFSFTILHEVGHAMGISHVHDGFSWEFGEYLYWLWDLSYSIMSYTQAQSGYATMDIQSYQQGTITNYWKEFIPLLNQTIANVKGMHDYYPTTVFDKLNQSIVAFNQSVFEYENVANPNNYDNATDLIFEAFDLLRQAENELDISILNFSIEVELNSNNVDYSEIIFEFNLTNKNFYIQGDLSGGLFIVLQDLPWTEFNLTISYQNETVYSSDGYTWNIPTSLIITLPLTETSTTTSSTTTSEISSTPSTPSTPTDSTSSSTSDQITNTDTTSSSEPFSSIPTQGSEPLNQDEGFVNFGFLAFIAVIPILVSLNKFRLRVIRIESY